MTSAAIKPDSPRALVRVLAVLTSSHERNLQAEARMLRELEVYQRLGFDEVSFEREAGRVRKVIAAAGVSPAGPGLDELEAFDDALALVRDPHHRLWLCRVASCLITLDGHIDSHESALYDRMLARWGYTRTSVSRAILEDHAH